MGQIRVGHYFPPKPISVDHQLDDFDSGELSLNEWLKKRALKNQATDPNAR